MAPCKPQEECQGDEDEVHDDDNETIKMGRRITLALFHKPCGRSEGGMMHDVQCVKTQRTTSLVKQGRYGRRCGHSKSHAN